MILDTGKSVNIAILGAEHGHTELFVPAMRTNESVARIVVSGRDQSLIRSRPAAALIDRFYEDEDELLSSENLDFVFVLGRHDEMPRLASKAIRYGAPVVIEKPGGLRKSHVERLREIAANSAVAMYVPFVQRVGDISALIKEVGVVEHFSVEFFAGPAQRYRDYGMPWILERKHAGCGVLLNLGVHFIDLFLHHVPHEQLEVQGVLSYHDSGVDVEDGAFLTLRTQSGAVGIVQTTYSFPSAKSRYVSFACRGSKGFVSVDSSGNAQIRSGDSVEERTVSVNSDEYYERWIHALLTGRFSKEIAQVEDLIQVRQITDRLLPA